MNAKLKEVSEECLRLRGVSDELNDYMLNRDRFLVEFEQLKQTREKQREWFRSELEKIEESQRQQIESLRKEMLRKVKDVKVRLMGVQEETLSKSTRLAMCQNVKLTGELELQSKEGETFIN